MLLAAYMHLANTSQRRSHISRAHQMVVFMGHKKQIRLLHSISFPHLTNIALETTMATQSASGRESPIMQFRDLWIYIQSASGLPERKLAKGTADDHSEMTEACLVSLGHNVPDDRRKELRCGHKALTWSIEFHIVERAGREVVLGSHDCEQVRAADDPGAFIVEASKKSKGA